MCFVVRAFRTYALQTVGVTILLPVLYPILDPSVRTEFDVLGSLLALHFVPPPPDAFVNCLSNVLWLILLLRAHRRVDQASIVNVPDGDALGRQRQRRTSNSLCKPSSPPSTTSTAAKWATGKPLCSHPCPSFLVCVSSIRPFTLAYLPCLCVILRGTLYLLERRLPDPIHAAHGVCRARWTGVLHHVLQLPARYQGECPSFTFGRASRSLALHSPTRQLRSRPRPPMFWTRRDCCIL